jgi:hypothetical protein
MLSASRFSKLFSMSLFTATLMMSAGCTGPTVETSGGTTQQVDQQQQHEDQVSEDLVAAGKVDLK